MVAAAAAPGFYDAALLRRQALMGESGPATLIKNGRVFMIAMFACIGGLLYGYNQGVFSGVLTMPSFQNHMGNYAGNAPENQSRKGWLTSILELGAWLGTLLSGFMAETASRKYGILIATAVFIIGVVVQATAISAGHNSILAGRFITGMGVGSLSMIVPMYNAEVAPPEVRGSLIALQQLAITFGIMVYFWIDYGTNYDGGTGSTQKDASWLIPICLQLFPAVILVIGIIFMPFSPRWLVYHGRKNEAREVLASLRGLPEDHELVELEFLEIKAQSLFEKRTIAENFPQLQELTAWNTFKLQFVAIGSLFRTKAMFKRVIVATVTMFFQQWTGINAILYYAPTIFQSLGLSGNTISLLATGVVGIAMFLATIPSVLYIDKIGRKPILTVGALGMGSCHIIIAAIVATYRNSWPEHKAAGWAAVAMVWLFVVHFGYSWGPCAWIIVAEIWALSNRPYGITLGASSNWMNNFIVGHVTPDMITGISYGTYLIFGILTFMGAAFVWFFVPETKRLTLEEMDVIFGSEGTAQADHERMGEINHEIGLDALLRAGVAGVPGSPNEKSIIDEKESHVEYKLDPPTTDNDKRKIEFINLIEDDEDHYQKMVPMQNLRNQSAQRTRNVELEYQVLKTIERLEKLQINDKGRNKAIDDLQCTNKTLGKNNRDLKTANNEHLARTIELENEFATLQEEVATLQQEVQLLKREAATNILTKYIASLSKERSVSEGSTVEDVPLITQDSSLFFARLPIELRWTIWELCRPEPRAIKICVTDGWKIRTKSVIPSSLLRVCHESRHVAMKWYTPPVGTDRIPSEEFMVYFDWDFNYLYISCPKFRAGSRCIRRPRKERMQCELHAYPNEILKRVAIEAEEFMYAVLTLSNSPECKEALFMKPHDANPEWEAKITELTKLPANEQIEDGKSLLEKFYEYVEIADQQDVEDMNLKSMFWAEYSQST